jgi:serine/threonine protein kinase
LGDWNKSKIALKKLRNDDDVKALVAEVKIAKKLLSPNVVSVYGVCSFNNEIFVMMQCCENGDLRNYLKVKKCQNVKSHQQQAKK